MKTRKGIIEAFANGETDGAGGSAHTGTPSASIQGLQFFSYKTIIACRFVGARIAWVSSITYSNTTTRQQSALHVALERSGYTVVRSTTIPGNLAAARALEGKPVVSGRSSAFPKRSRKTRGTPFGQLVNVPAIPVLSVDHTAEW